MLLSEGLVYSTVSLRINPALLIEGPSVSPNSRWVWVLCTLLHSARCSSHSVRVLCISWSTAVHSSAWLLEMTATQIQWDDQ